MGKKRSSSALSPETPAADTQGVRNTPAAPELPALVNVPDLRLRSLGRPRTVAVFAVLAVFVLIGGSVLGTWALRNIRSPAVGSPSAASPAGGDWSKAPITSEEWLCARFIQLKNNGDPTAAALLGPPTTAPDGSVAPEEADRLDTEYFLRQDIHFTGVGRAAKPGQLVLYAKGSVSAPELHVRTASGVESRQRVLFNPDITVEVRDGRIFGVSSSAHMGP